MGGPLGCVCTQGWRCDGTQVLATGMGKPRCDQKSQEGAVRGASECGSASEGSWVCAEAGETVRPVSAFPPAEGGSLLCASEHSFQESRAGGTA